MPTLKCLRRTAPIGRFAARRAKPTCLILLAALITSLTISCKDDLSCASAASGSATDAEITETDVVDWRDANLPERNFDGQTFTVIHPKPSRDLAWYYFDIDEENGEPINDAVYKRNRTVEEAFNVKIEAYISTDTDSEVVSSISAGDNAFDAIHNGAYYQLGYAQRGYLFNLYNLQNMDLGQDWWDQNLIKSVTINGKLYYATGDLSAMMNGRSFSLVFNKDMCTDLGIEYPYQYVLDGTWTMEVFEQYVKNVNFDLDGDSDMDYDDRWGYFSESGNSYMMFFSAGGRLTESDSNGIPQIVADSESNIDIMTRALSITEDKNITILANGYVADHGWTGASEWFASGKALMRVSTVDVILRDYRKMETDFGVLPFPKYSEEQAEYRTLSCPYERSDCLGARNRRRRVFQHYY